MLTCWVLFHNRPRSHTLDRTMIGISIVMFTLATMVKCLVLACGLPILIICLSILLSTTPVFLRPSLYLRTSRADLLHSSANCQSLHKFLAVPFTLLRHWSATRLSCGFSLLSFYLTRHNPQHLAFQMLDCLG